MRTKSAESTPMQVLRVIGLPLSFRGRVPAHQRAAVELAESRIHLPTLRVSTDQGGLLLLTDKAMVVVVGLNDSSSDLLSVMNRSAAKSVATRSIQPAHGAKFK
jgi:hypothetical protein